MMLSHAVDGEVAVRRTVTAAIELVRRGSEAVVAAIDVRRETGAPDAGAGPAACGSRRWAARQSRTCSPQRSNLNRPVRVRRRLGRWRRRRPSAGDLMLGFGFCIAEKDDGVDQPDAFDLIGPIQNPKSNNIQNAEVLDLLTALADGLQEAVPGFTPLSTATGSPDPHGR